MRVHWSPRAIRDADEAAAYIAGERPAAAERWLTGLFEAVRRLEWFPESGRTVPLPGGPERREVLYRGYRIIYRTGARGVEIVTVMHMRRQLRPEDL
ncbi:MAG TPA: type II toxin-antitoxin system RelE/ParE family toxin [Longimicrobiaceae bacterium]|nr:type II toxin-antitoxin system RelE/ParE family toxin [Longimicrobiaceae bacterium]